MVMRTTNVSADTIGRDGVAMMIEGLELEEVELGLGGMVGVEGVVLMMSEGRGVRDIRGVRGIVANIYDHKLLKAAEHQRARYIGVIEDIERVWTCRDYMKAGDDIRVAMRDWLRGVEMMSMGGGEESWRVGGLVLGV